MIALLLVAAVAVLVVFGFLFLRLAESLVGRTVGGNAEDAEQIMTSGCVPEGWLIDLRGAHPRVRRGMNKARAIRRLRKLIRYYRGTPLVPDEQARAETLSRLRAVLAHWKRAAWSEILPLSMQR